MKGEVLPDSSLLVLALLAEGETHGYDIQKLAHNRGFRFWTKLQRSSIYNALALLENNGLINAHVRAGEGPDRNVFRITKRGLIRLQAEGIRHLSTATHPRSEIDLGIYVLPFISRVAAKRAFERCLATLRGRRDFLEERLEWCRTQGLWVPALAFERPLLALKAEIQWLERVASEFAKHGASREEWVKYVYREPPRSESKGAERP